MTKLETYKKLTKDYIDAHNRYWERFGHPIIKLDSQAFFEMKKLWSELVVAQDQWSAFIKSNSRESKK